MLRKCKTYADLAIYGKKSLFLQDHYGQQLLAQATGQYRKLKPELASIFTAASNRSIKKAEEQPSLLPFYFAYIFPAIS